MYAGAGRDFVLGATLLDARGEILRFGGQVMKNVAGFDVSRLLCGSLGILGVITEVSLKVFPQPRAEETLRFEMPSQSQTAPFGDCPSPTRHRPWIFPATLQLTGAVRCVGTPTAAPPTR